MTLKLPTSIIFSLALVIALAASTAAQQKRQTPVKPQAAAAPTPVPTPPPTFDTLLVAGSYRVYSEVRSVGQLVRSNAVTEILEPIMKLAGPPREFRTVVSWLNTHADELMTSRMLFAAWPSMKEIPEAVVAIEFASAEEATKFQQKLDGFLQKMTRPASNPAGTAAGETPETATRPPYYMQRAGALILITPTALDLKKLRPAGSKLLAEDANFRVSRNRFNSESIFVFVDVAEIVREEEEQRKKYEEAHKQAVAASRATHEETEKAVAELQKEIEETESPPPPVAETRVGVELGTTPPAGEPKDVPQAAGPNHADLVMGMLFGSFGGAEAKWPQAIGGAISLEGDSIDARVLLVNAPGEKSDPVPFLPVLAAGPLITPETPGILPADTEMLVTMSVDLPQVFTTMTKPWEQSLVMTSTDGKEQRYEGPYAAIEKQLNIKIKDDLLPLIGSEIAISLPVTGWSWIQPPPLRSSPPSSASPSLSASPAPDTGEDATGESKPARQLAVTMSLKDKEGMRALLPKLIEKLAFKGANAFAQTERREDTELVSYANLVAYAFIGNFLVVSSDVATTRHIVDSYLKHQTLAGDPHFKNYTRWQPRQLQGQIYISPSLMENYRTWIQQPTAPVDEKTRAFLTRFTIVAQPVTYSLSNEGFGPLHELHLPKNLVLLIIASAAGGIGGVQDMPSNTPPPSNPSPTSPDNPN